MEEDVLRMHVLQFYQLQFLVLYIFTYIFESDNVDSNCNVLFVSY